MVVDLHLVAVVHRHPLFSWLDGDADEHARVVVLVAHFVHHADDAVTHRAGGPIEQAHASVGLDESVLDGHVSRADVFPAIEVLAIEELDPVILRDKRKSENQKYCEQSETFHDMPPERSLGTKANCPQRRIMRRGNGCWQVSNGRPLPAIELDGVELRRL